TTVGFEAAESVGEVQPQAFVEPARDLKVDPPALFGRSLVGIEDPEITAPRDDVGLLETPGELGNPGGLVLAVAIKRHQSVVAPLDRLLERSAQPCSVTQV